jgi:hypothetical protein
MSKKIRFYMIGNIIRRTHDGYEEVRQNFGSGLSHLRNPHVPEAWMTGSTNS